MSLHNGDKARANRIRRHRQVLRERSRAIRRKLQSGAPAKLPKK